MRLSVLALVLLGIPRAPLAGPPAPEGDTYLPLGKGYKWVYKTDYDEMEIVHEVAGAEKVGDVDCFVVEHKTVIASADRTRVLWKEWVAVSDEGVKIHKLQRGRSEITIEKPFFKIKDILKKDDEWEGLGQAEENPPKYHYLVEEENEVEVPAGKFKAWKVHVKIESGDRHTSDSYEWYAKGVGLVKAEMTVKFGNEGATTISELKEFKRPTK